MIVGGLRARLLRDSLIYAIDNGLQSLGWLDPGRSHAPVRLQAEPANWDEPIQPNLVAVNVVTSETEEVEVGSWLTTDTLTTHVDIFAENDSFGVDLSNDLRDLLRGRLLPTAASGTIPILDLRQATPPIIGHITVGAVNALRNLSVAQEVWMRHWFRVRAELQDTYYSSEG